MPFNLSLNRFLYRQTISMDCNFRVKNRYRSTKKPDIHLSPGWSYMVEPTGYMDYVKNFASQVEVCVILSRKSWPCSSGS